MRIAIILSLLVLWLSGGANAQNTIEGRVTDKETRRPLESASVTLQQGAEGNIIGYALTDSDGRFRLSSSSSEEENRIITVRYMGYKQVSLPPLFNRTMHIALEQEAVLLKEVQIRPGRVWGRQDTLKSAHRYMFYTVPRLEWEGNRFWLTASAAMHWSRFPGQSYSSLCVNPSFYFRYKFTPRWKISLSGSMDKTEDGLEDIYPSPYRKDYRSVVAHAGIVPETVRRLYSLYGEYRNTVKEFFWTTSLSCLHARHNLMTERNYTDGIFHLSSAKHSNSTRSYTLESILSKGVYDWHVKTSLKLLLSRNEGKQLNEGVIQDYQYECLRAEPKIIWAPSPLFEAEYRAVVGYSSSKVGKGTRLDPLWDISQRMTLQFGFHHAELTLSGEHFYNELSDTQHLHTWLADASLGYKSGKWRWAVHVSNLFDKKQYSYTLYSAVQSYASWVKLRPRECRVSVQYQW